MQLFASDGSITPPNWTYDPTYQFPTEPNNGHYRDYTYAVEDRPTIISLIDNPSKSLTKGSLYTVTLVRLTDNGFLIRITNDIGGTKFLGSNLRTSEFEVVKENEDPPTPSGFVNSDLGRNIIWLKDVSTNKEGQVNTIVQLGNALEAVMIDNGFWVGYNGKGNNWEFTDLQPNGQFIPSDVGRFIVSLDTEILPLGVSSMIVSINQDRAYINQGNNELTAINKLSQNTKWRFQDETFTIFQDYQVGWTLNVNTSSGSEFATITNVESETQATVQFSNNTQQQVQNTSFGNNWTFIAPFSSTQLPEKVNIEWLGGSNYFSPVTG